MTRTKTKPMPTSTDDIAAECEVLAKRLSMVGEGTWMLGSWFGPDRVSGRTKKDTGIGDERIYAIGIVIEMAGDVGQSSVILMRAGRTYGAQSLTRHLIECEYLVASFAQDPEAAREWLNADKETRRTYWSPQKLRNRMPGMFRDTEYWTHSDTSHPTPWARAFLASHSPTTPVEDWWAELHLHLTRLALRSDEAVKALGIGQAAGVATEPA